MAELRTLDVADYENIAKFLCDFSSKGFDHWVNRFRFWWEDNPAFKEGAARGWLLEENGSVGGFIANVPSLLQVSGEEQTVCNVSSWYVSPEFRKQSMDLFFKINVMGKDTFVFNTTPSQEVIKILEMFKFHKLPNGNDPQSLLPIRMSALLRSLLDDTFSGKIIPSLFGWPLQLAFDIRYKLKQKQSSFKVRKISAFDDALDELWHRTKDLYLVTNVRNKAMLNWYCFGSESHTKDVFGCYNRNQLIGFIVCRQFSRKDLKVLELLDVWSDPELDNVVEPLILEAREFAKENAVDVIQVPHYSQKFGNTLRGAGLLARNPEESTSYYNGPRSLLKEISSINSYFCRAQGDNGL